MPGRKFVSGEEYRFGFNGVEQEDEVAEGVNFTYFRMQDSRLGRWWSHDPKPNVSVSPYAMMENNPVMFSDVLGDTIVFNTEDQKLLSKIDKMRTESKMFNAVYERLDESEYVFRVGDATIDAIGANGKYMKDPNYLRKYGYAGLILIANNGRGTIAEEFFHAFQDLYYVLENKYFEDINELGGGLEYEAKFFRQLLHGEINNSFEFVGIGASEQLLIEYDNDTYEVMANMPEGFYSFAENVYLGGLANIRSEEVLKEYLRLGKSFSSYYKTTPGFEDSLYGLPVWNQPSAAISIFENERKFESLLSNAKY